MTSLRSFFGSGVRSKNSALGSVNSISTDLISGLEEWMHQMTRSPLGANSPGWQTMGSPLFGKITLISDMTFSLRMKRTVGNLHREHGSSTEWWRAARPQDMPGCDRRAEVRRDSMPPGARDS